MQQARLFGERFDCSVVNVASAAARNPDDVRGALQAGDGTGARSAVHAR